MITIGALQPSLLRQLRECALAFIGDHAHLELTREIQGAYDFLSRTAGAFVRQATSEPIACVQLVP
jgi:hypothetical protein